MKFSTQQLSGYKLLLTVILTSVFVPGTSLSTAKEIKNQASASGDNVPIVTSNQASLTAGQAILQLIKTADRAAAEPGDTVVYRLSLKNTGDAIANNIKITDTLPLGVRLLPQSVKGSITTGGATTPVTLPAPVVSNRTVTITYPSLEPQQTLNLVYAATVTPDAIRGDGRNVAQETRSNLASYRLRIRQGIASECGTLLGRVFVDKNFDGEQQPGEPGVPNAVIFMDDGNRITTDANGMFSVANVISGNRTAAIDLSSLPGYTLAPNIKFIESNSQSRLVRLQPGGMGRINFAVTPTHGSSDEKR
ncbi:MAG: hypothetical protein U7123_10690 [Potamolinea sp.]